MLANIRESKAKPIGNFSAKMGESPCWDTSCNSLYWVDIDGKKIFLYNPQKNICKEYLFDNEVECVVPRSKGGVMLTIGRSVVLFDFSTKKLKILGSVEPSKKNNRFNDGKCDPAGRFWAGTIHRKELPKAGSLYCIDTDYSIRKMIEGVTVSNGLTWSKDKKTFYFIDSPTYSVVAYEYNVETGNIRNKRKVIEINPVLGIPDGMTIDSEGMLWIAMFGGGKVSRWDPAKGKSLGFIEIPGAMQVTSCCFGGSDMKDLYITTASAGLTNTQLQNQPYAGLLFKARIGIAGLPLWQFTG